MGVNARKSEDYLHTDVILSKITEYDIFRFYCSSFKKLGIKFKSELRGDSSPTVSIIVWKGRLLYKDFGRPDHTFNCWGYVMHKYSFDFRECLRVISSDFNLGLTEQSLSNTIVAQTYGEQDFGEKRQARIRIKRRDWDTTDKEFWEQFYIGKELLFKFGVSPIKYFWINETRFKCYSNSYCFDFRGARKIYCPYETDHKWYSNTSKECIQGYSELPENGKIIFLTSSLKDVMCLEVLGYKAIALQSEMQMPDEMLIKELKSRFTKVVVLYDNDFNSKDNPGQMMAGKICNEHTLVNICIPTKYQSKDISDLIKNYGLDEANKFIKTSLSHGISIL